MIKKKSIAQNNWLFLCKKLANKAQNTYIYARKNNLAENIVK